MCMLAFAYDNKLCGDLWLTGCCDGAKSVICWSMASQQNVIQKCVYFGNIIWSAVQLATLQLTWLG